MSTTAPKTMKADIACLESEFATVRQKMQAYLKELGLGGFHRRL